jgi:hypothetical protein
MGEFILFAVDISSLYLLEITQASELFLISGLLLVFQVMSGMGHLVYWFVLK